MAGGVLALEGAAGGLELLLVGVRMSLAAVQAAQVAHHARTPLPHHGPAQRAVPGQEQGPQRPHVSFLPCACPAQSGVRDPWSGSAAGTALPVLVLCPITPSYAAAPGVSSTLLPEEFTSLWRNVARTPSQFFCCSKIKALNNAAA
jgi:hypothetical protein